MLLLVLALAGCATTSAAPSPDKAAVTLDLGLLGPETPATLTEAAKAPYMVPPGADCAWLRSQIASLDLVLGPDVDIPPAPRNPGDQIERTAGDALAGMVPYRGVIRWMTGAGRKERARTQAVLAAAARRGFLKGVAWSRACGELRATEPHDHATPDA